MPKCLVHLGRCCPGDGVDDALLVVEEGGRVELEGAGRRLDPLHRGREGFHRRVEPAGLRVPASWIRLKSQSHLTIWVSFFTSKSIFWG